ncbi:MAG: rod shape-determining protein RodA [Candidatus Yonathbacteria bacterium CG_4_10_14_3_um_filter_47_65]|uniref:Rod shape-determining protein RodA n=2 Tax=Parcubacteria group TaxID=1794811 RepID=A0A2M8D5A4_9BACT|nr:MAG: rod shape-determining protein RodA [Candidatus Nomurabacteria bacterium CG1_02_47_685]PIP03557.1 MAG: rod shape-determining protein RodA [Candidatus Yonathbacteria bacterium CG23_combo_of_CG06-09_8_20_14_all_46_18]PIQ31439.1 MAG: rod shape-determining protein RodA [Candidatus Yonathbacteria bacterium CG17_big_fil_post_rev_8_21_14_2_50_46_19]PIX56197.1 MAG: rod shape-determining protein RodA [Candidatus Yonathbacteria bacterium CG_4_10_14_3_um_filter_47_65]PIY57588.1 MAG: rod shape-deter
MKPSFLEIAKNFGVSPFRPARGGRSLSVDWTLFFATIPLLCAGLVTMNSFTGDNYFFEKQIIWITAAFLVFFMFSLFDFRFLKRTNVLMALFAIAIAVLIGLFVLNHAVKGARSWLDFGAFSLQPSDPVKILVILILAKYFSRRHVEIAHIKHVLISGFYAFVPFVLVLLQPDFGSAVIIFLIWLGMVMVSGISKKHLAGVFLLGVLAAGLLWSFVFKDYQKDRIMTFIHPLTDIQGAGYNAYQSTIAVGSGETLGKGVGYGTQSRLRFLPEYQTDFIFAAFAEEWGFVGVVILFALFGVIIWRVLAGAILGVSNFEILFGMGVAIMFMSHIMVNVGMNIGLLPVTGTPLPFLSYGGSHLITEFAALGMLQGMRRYNRAAHKDDTTHEFLGI